MIFSERCSPVHQTKTYNLLRSLKERDRQRKCPSIFLSMPNRTGPPISRTPYCTLPNCRAIPRHSSCHQAEKRKETSALLHKAPAEEHISRFQEIAPRPPNRGTRHMRGRNILTSGRVRRRGLMRWKVWGRKGDGWGCNPPFPGLGSWFFLWMEAGVGGCGGSVMEGRSFR